MNCPGIKRGIPTTVSQLLTQIQVLVNKVNSLSDAREFDDLETASSAGATQVNPLLLRVPGPGLVAVLDCRMIPRIMWVLQETLLNDYLLEGQTSTLFTNSKNLGFSSQELRPDGAHGILGSFLTPWNFKAA